MISENLHKNSILIVDDQPQNIQLIGTLLRNHYNLYVADSGEKAIKIAIDKKPDLILLDIMMPVLSGFEVCQILKSDTETMGIPIIFLTAKNESDDIVTGFSLGAVDYITKPFKSEEVLIRVSTHLKLKEAVDELKRRNHEKDRFFSIIAHDLNNPFNGFIALTAMVRDKMDKFSPEELKNFMDMMNSSANQLHKLLENLLEWARLQMGNVKFKPSYNNFFNCVEKAFYYLRNNLEEKNIQTVIDIPRDLGFVYDVDMLETVLRNLVSNAIKFTNTGGNIHVSSEIRDGEVIISIKDSGIGMSESLKSKIFKLSESVSRKGTSGEESTGLGLILCKDLVEMNNGKIWFESEIDKGTTFYVSFPYVSK